MRGPAAEHGFEQLDVDIVLLPRTELREHVGVDLDEIRRRLGLQAANDHDDWRPMCALLRQAVGESVFAIWIESIELVTIDSQYALVIAPPTATRDWVQKPFGGLLSECAQQVSRQLRFADDAEGAAFGHHDDRRPTAGGQHQHPTTTQKEGPMVSVIANQKGGGANWPGVPRAAASDLPRRPRRPRPDTAVP